MSLAEVGVDSIPYRFQTDCTHKSCDMTYLKTHLSHTFSMVEGQGCPSAIENVWDYGKAKILKMSCLMIYNCTMLEKYCKLSLWLMT